MIRGWRDWSIQARVVVACVMPVCMTFVVTVGFLYRTHRHEMQETMQAHANLMAHALSDSAHYGVIFGNWDYLNQTAQTLLNKTSSAPRKITVFDKDRKLLLLRETAAAPDNPCGSMIRLWCGLLLGDRQEELLRVEVPIESMPVALPRNDPWLQSSPSAASVAASGATTIGYLTIVVSSAEFMRQQWWRIGVGSSMALGVLLVSGWLGWRLARSVTRPLTQLVAAVRKIQGGRYETGLAKSAGGEIGELQQAIIEMAAHLTSFNRALEDKVLTRTRELEAAKDELTRLNEERRRLIQRIQSAAEDERRKIAFALHDHWNAQVIAIRLQASHALKLSEASPQAGPAAPILAPLHAIIDTTEQLYASGRDLIKQLYPEMIEVVGVAGAIEAMIETYNANHPTCAFLLRVEGKLPFAHGDKAIMLYRLVQEALSNAVKHAAATQVCVLIAHERDHARLKLIIADDGRGFDPAKVNSGMGLIGMRERAQAFGGALSIQSRPGEGTTVRVSLCVREEARASGPPHQFPPDKPIPANR